MSTIFNEYHRKVATDYWTTGQWTHIRLLDSNRLMPVYILLYRYFYNNTWGKKCIYWTHALVLGSMYFFKSIFPRLLVPFYDFNAHISTIDTISSSCSTSEKYLLKIWKYFFTLFEVIIYEKIFYIFIVTYNFSCFCFLWVTTYILNTHLHKSECLSIISTWPNSSILLQRMNLAWCIICLYFNS